MSKKVFRIYRAGLYSQVHCVVAEDFAEAEKIWKESGGSEPEKIELYSNYVYLGDERE